MTIGSKRIPKVYIEWHPRTLSKCRVYRDCRLGFSTMWVSMLIGVHRRAEALR